MKDWSIVPSHRHNDAMICASWCMGLCTDGATRRHAHLAPNQLPAEYTNKLLEVVTNGKTRADEVISRVIRDRTNTNLGNRWQGRQ